jgi:AbrB family looped-hinge helix DNA binding protein
MSTVKLSSKYQMVIPADIRKKMDAKPGQEFWVDYDRGQITFIPKKDIRELFGTLKGLDTSIERDEKDRL